MKNQRSRIGIVSGMLLGVILCGCGSSSTPPPQEPPSSLVKPKVLIVPAATMVKLGDTVPLSLEVKDVGKTFYVAFDLTYDPKVVDYVEATEGTFLNRNGMDPTSFQSVSGNNGQGKVALGLTRLGQVGEVSGSGTLLTFLFKTVGPGTTTLSLTNPKGFKNIKDQDVTIDTWGEGTVTVQ